jgi:hypothetical protein
MSEERQMRSARRPPLGVKPRHLWLEAREQVLKRAIAEYVQDGFYGPVGVWLDELRRMHKK